MKVLFSIFVAVLITANVFAQAPQKMSYQAVIRNSSNNLVTNKTVGMRISILQGSITGTAVYKERQTPLANANGLVTIQIGAGNVQLGVFSTINWGAGPYYVKTETDTAGGTVYSITSTTQLLSVPYALYAEKSGTATNSYTHYIGEKFGGGIVFYLFRDTDGVEHGLIASLQDIPAPSTPWSPVNGYIGAAAMSLWDGLSNSNAIVAQSTNSCAYLCRSYNAGGFTDWYLPALFQLQLLYGQIFLIERNLPNGGFNNSSTRYWSSTENGANEALSINILYYTDYYPIGKTGTGAGVRAIRSF